MSDLDCAFKAEQPWVQTVSGRKLHFLDPAPEEIDLHDLATALSHLCRFTGHLRAFYSVAQHCVLVSTLVPRGAALAGLLHDAAEAYLGDVSRPVKHRLYFDAGGSVASFKMAEERLQRVILRRFGVAEELPECVHEADDVALATEARDLLFCGVVPPEWGRVAPLAVALEPWGPERARREFLQRFYVLQGVTQ